MAPREEDAWKEGRVSRGYSRVLCGGRTAYAQIRLAALKGSAEERERGWRDARLASGDDTEQQCVGARRQRGRRESARIKKISIFYLSVLSWI